jgi:hypothetical protein
MPRFIEYRVLETVAPAHVNPKAHDLDLIGESFARFDYVEPIIIDERTERLISGHGRLESLTLLRAAGKPAPEGIRVEHGVWLVPVVRGWASKDDNEAAGYLVAANRITEVGGWKEDQLLSLLQNMDLSGVGFVNDDIDDLLAKLQEVALNDPSDVAPGLRNQQVRMMVLYYPLEDYFKVTEAAAAARVRFGVESNAELFQSMLTTWDRNNPDEHD